MGTNPKRAGLQLPGCVWRLVSSMLDLSCMSARGIGSGKARMQLIVANRQPARAMLLSLRPFEPSRRARE